MSLRFTETNKWKDDWYLSLNNDNKIIWQYVIDNCSIAGIWKSGFTSLNFFCKTEITEQIFQEIFSDKFYKLSDSYFVPNYLKVQYPHGLNSEKPMIISARKELLSHKDFTYIKSIIEQSLGNDYLIIKVKVRGNSKGKGKEARGKMEKEKIANPLFVKCNKYYFDWYEKRFGMKPDFDGSDGIALKNMLTWFGQQPNNAGDEKVYLTFTTMLSNFDKWDKFHQGQVRIRQINSNKSNILNTLKNGKSGTITANSIADALEKRFAEK